MPATSSAFIICPLVFLINMVVSNLPSGRSTVETARRNDNIMRNLPHFPGQGEKDGDGRVRAFTPWVTGSPR
jgi:cation/acetate symporter